MAIHEQQANQVEGGFSKKINEGSMRMMLDNLQRTQYQYPYKSTVRELVSNGIDAIRERDTAISILTGKTKVEDHFVVKEGSEYVDSKFDPTYYDQQWLSTDPTIYIIYKEGAMLDKDKLIIQDNGVGLGGKRLEGYFDLGFSTKRLSKFGLGKYGIGAKAALSTGTPYYTVKNRYNGVETHWNIYPYQVESTIPKWDIPSGSGEPIENPFMILDNEEKTLCYYKNTSEKNGLEITLEVKKHHKQQYIDAVKSQLLYFDNIVFRIEAANGVVETIPVKADVLYEDDIMILSDNKMYTRPHILINKVNYGLIDFKELELEDKEGNISIKMKPEEVSVSPSREHVLWDEMTHNAVVNRFKQVQVAAEKLLQGELDQPDFMKWLKACILIKNKIGSERADGLVARLAKLVDLQQYEPKYKPDPDFKLGRDLFAGIKVRKIIGKTERSGSSYKFVVDRKVAGLSDLVNDELPIFIQQGDTSWLKDRYLLEELYHDGFITIWLNDTEVQKPPVGTAEGTADSEEEAEKIYQGRKAALLHFAQDTAAELKWYDPKFEGVDTSQVKAKAYEAAQRVLERWRKLNQYILSSEGIQLYDSFVVPDHYKNQSKEQDDENNTIIRQENEVQTKEARMSAEARRKLNGKTILFTPRATNYIGSSTKEIYSWHKLEIPVTEIDAWNNPEVFYSSEDNASLLQLAACITRPYENLNGQIGWEDEEEHILNIPTSNPPVTQKKTIERSSYLTAYDGHPDVKLIKVAKDRVKYYRDFKYIHDFFAQVNTKTKTITMSNALIRWNTARHIHEQLPKLKFLTRFKPFHEEYSNLFHSMNDYCNKYYREVSGHTGKYKELQKQEYDDMIRHLDKVTELQVFVRDHPEDSQAIANLVRELFGTGLKDTVTDGCGIDINIRDIVQKLLDYGEPIQVMLNQMPVLTDDDADLIITEELEIEIRNYIEFKKAGM